MAFGDYNRLTSISRSYVMPSVVHQLKKEMPLFGRLLAKSKKRSGGTTIDIPVTYAYNTAGGSYSGLEVLDTNQVQTRTRAVYNWKQVYQPIVISNIEVFKNGGSSDTKIVDLMKQEMEEAKESIKDKLSTMVFGDGTGNASKNLLGLQGLVDDGTTVASIGGITLATYTWFASTVSAAVGSLTLSHMATQFSAASSGRGVEAVDLLVTTETVLNAYEALMQPSVRYNYAGSTAPKIDTIGGNSLFFRGAEVVADEYCASGELYFLNTRHLQLIVGDHPDHPTDKNGFTVTPMSAPHDQDGKVGFILLYGEVVNSRPARMAKSTGVTA